MKLNRIVILSIFFCLSKLSFSQEDEVWDWQKCIDYAMQNNLQILQSGLNVQSGEVTLKQQKMNYTPMINASSNYNLRVGNNFNFFTSEYTRELVHYQDYGMNISQPIFDATILPGVKKGKLDVQALQLDQEVLKNNINLQILTAFLNIMNAKEQYQQALNQKTSTEEQRQRLLSLIEAGAAAEKSILDLDAQLTGEELTIAQARNQLDLAYLQLKMILQLDVKKNISVKIPELPEALDIDSLEELNKIYDDALSLKPEIKSSRVKIESAKKGIDVAKGNYYPNLSFIGNLNTFFSSQNKNYTQVLTGNSTAVGIVEGTFQRVLIPETITEQSNNPYNKQLNQNLSFTFGLTLNIPIYNKYQVQTAVKQSKLQYQSSMLSGRQAEVDLYNSISQAYVKARSAIASYTAAQRNFETSQRSYDYAMERLGAGSINQLEVNLAKTTLSISESRLIQAKYEYLFNTKVLDFYQGKKITLD